MNRLARRKGAACRLLAVAGVLFALAGCRSEKDAAPPPAADAGERPVAEGPSRAADPMIENAKTPEEKAALEKARDEVDAEMREKVRALDEEIVRLRKENEQLKTATAADDARSKSP